MIGLAYDFIEPIKPISEEQKFEEGLTIEQYHKLVDAADDYLRTNHRIWSPHRLATKRNHKSKAEKTEDI